MKAAETSRSLLQQRGPVQHDADGRSRRSLVLSHIDQEPLAVGENCGVETTSMFGGSGSRWGTALSKAVPLVFTGAAKVAVPVGAVFKTISLSTRHSGQLPWSFETCHLPS